MCLLSPNSAPHLNFSQMDVNNVDSSSRWKIELFAVGVPLSDNANFGEFTLLISKGRKPIATCWVVLNQVWKWSNFCCNTFEVARVCPAPSQHLTTRSQLWKVARCFVEMLRAFDGALRYNVGHSMNLILNIPLKRLYDCYTTVCNGWTCS